MRYRLNISLAQVGMHRCSAILRREPSASRLGCSERLTPFTRLSRVRGRTRNRSYTSMVTGRAWLTPFQNSDVL